MGLRTMKKTGLAVLTLILAACTSTADIQRQCAAVTQSFTDEISCFEAQVAQDSYLSGDSFVQEYVLLGRVLADKVRSGQINENEARLQMSRAYNDLVMRQQQYSAYSAIEFESLRPRHTTCHDVNGVTHCDTY